MRRSTRTLLGLAAATAIIGIGVPMATATSASATPASATSWDDYDYSDSWGPYYAYHHLAKSKGHIDVEYNGEESNTVDISGKVYDYDYRYNKCGYVKFRYTNWDDDEYDWNSNYYWYYWCAPSHSTSGYWPFHFSLDDVSQVQVKVCQIKKYDAQHGYSNNYFNCKGWHDIYNAYDEEEYNYSA